MQRDITISMVMIQQIYGVDDDEVSKTFRLYTLLSAIYFALNFDELFKWDISQEVSV